VKNTKKQAFQTMKKKCVSIWNMAIGFGG